MDKQCVFLGRCRVVASWHGNGNSDGGVLLILLMQWLWLWRCRNAPGDGSCFVVVAAVAVVEHDCNCTVAAAEVVDVVEAAGGGYCCCNYYYCYHCSCNYDSDCKYFHFGPGWNCNYSLVDLQILLLMIRRAAAAEVLAVDRTAVDTSQH